MENKTCPAHLGGHAGITHVDIGALKWAITAFDVKTALDVGCGVGDMVKVMLDNGIDAYGIEGDPTLNWGRPDKFERHDYTIGPLIMDKTDLVWAVEFLEHIEEEYLDNVFSTLSNATTVICTAASPGTEEAHHHVNCKDELYWRCKFAEYGFEYNELATASLRKSSTMERDFMRKTGMVFINKAGYTLEDVPEWVRIEASFIEDEESSSTQENIEIDEVPVTNEPQEKVEILNPKTGKPLKDNQEIINGEVVTYNKDGSIRKKSGPKKKAK